MSIFWVRSHWSSMMGTSCYGRSSSNLFSQVRSLWAFLMVPLRLLNKRGRWCKETFSWRNPILNTKHGSVPTSSCDRGSLVRFPKRCWERFILVPHLASENFNKSSLAREFSLRRSLSTINQKGQDFGDLLQRFQSHLRFPDCYW